MDINELDRLKRGQELRDSIEAIENNLTNLDNALSSFDGWDIITIQVNYRDTGNYSHKFATNPNKHLTKAFLDKHKGVLQHQLRNLKKEFEDL